MSDMHPLFRHQITYKGLTFMLKDVKPSFISGREKCDANMNPRPSKSVKDCRSFCSMVKILSLFLKDITKCPIPNFRLENNTSEMSV